MSSHRLWYRFRGQAKIAEPLKPEEQAALSTRQYDRFLHLLERRIDPSVLRTRIMSTLTGKAPNTLHAAILDLARIGDAKYRLVTTNFDTLFEEMAAKKAVTLKYDAAPRLAPIPHAGLEVLVYLHGRIDPGGDPEGINLVVTSSDFGRAYLTERWASRFIAELFRRYSVLFIGYSADDPVMRYVLDAFSMTKGELHDSGTPRFYAVARYRRRKDRERQRLAWLSKGIQPILYLAGGSQHARLTRRMERWSDAFRDGISSKTYVAARILERGPTSLLGRESELLWLLADPSGVPARRSLLDAGGSRPNASAAWLEVFDRLELPGTGPILSQGYRAIQEADVVPCFLAGTREQGDSCVGLGPRAHAFAEWMAALAIDESTPPGGTLTNSEELLRWVHRKGGALHPIVLGLVQRELRRAPLSNARLRDLWYATVSPAINIALQRRWLDEDPIPRLESGDWTPELSEALLRALDPFVRLQQAGVDELRFDVQIVLRYPEDLRFLEQRLRQCLESTPPPVPFLEHIQSRLERALELAHRYVSSFDAVEGMQYGAIRGLGVNRFRQWTLLADLCWVCAAELEGRNAIEAQPLFERWRRSSFTTFRRLALRAATTWRGLTGDQRLSALSDD